MHQDETEEANDVERQEGDADERIRDKNGNCCVGVQERD
jgi:hypothetical protein